jgi:uroporphyrinogen-III synthase
MRRVLVLRPEPGARETVRRAEEQGLEAVAVPLFEIEPVPWEAPDAASFDALLVTSANAFRHAGSELNTLRGLPVYAVGDATAEAARDAGFDIKGSGGAGVDRLLGSIETDGKLLHLCGEDRTGTGGARQAITPVVVYRAKEVGSPDLSNAAGAIALLHSPRAARRFAELATAKSKIAIAAFSQAAAEQAGNGWEAVAVARAPNDEALLAVAARLCNTSAPT